MGETGFVRFPGNLDPRAEEFRPRNPLNNNQTQITLIRPPHLYYQYGPPAPSPPPPPLPPFASTDVHVLPFCDGSGLGIGGYAHYPPVQSPYVATTTVAQVPVPPASAVATRTLLLSSVAGDVSESSVRRDLEVFGEVRGVQMERVREGIVTVHFYDLRHADKALKEIRDQHMQHQTRLRNHYYALMVRNSGSELDCFTSSFSSPLPPPAPGLVAGRAVWAQFIIPASNAVPEGNNQGTIVVFNLDSGVSSSSLREIFKAFGAVKELRETPLKKHQRFIEFYDIRDAAKALKEMNGQEINGKSVVIEFSRPGGYSKKLFNAQTTTTAISNINSNTSHYLMNSDYNIPPPLPFPPPPPLSTPTNVSSTNNFSHHSLQPFKKKPPSSSSSKANPNVTLEGLSLGDQDAAIVGIPADGNPRRTCKKSQSNNHHHQSLVSTTTKQQVKNKTRLWKGRQAKKFDARFLINGDAMVDSNSKDSRTTVMIKNIPNKYRSALTIMDSF